MRALDMFWGKKLKSPFRIPCKSSPDIAGLRTQTQTLCLKKAPAQDMY